MGRKSSQTIIYAGDDTYIQIFVGSDIAGIAAAAGLPLLPDADCALIAHALTRAFYTGALSESLRSAPSSEQSKKYFRDLHKKVEGLASHLGFPPQPQHRPRKLRDINGYGTFLIGYAAGQYDVANGSTRSTRHYKGPTTQALDNLSEVVASLLGLSAWAQDHLPSPPYEGRNRRPKEAGADNLFMQLSPAFYAMFGRAPETGRAREDCSNDSRLWIEAVLDLAAKRIRQHIEPSPQKNGPTSMPWSAFVVQLAEKAAAYKPIYKADRLADGWKDWLELPDRFRWLPWRLPGTDVAGPPVWLAGIKIPGRGKIARKAANLSTG